MSGTIANPPLWAYIETQMKSANFFVHVLILIRMKSVEWNTRVPHPKAGNAAQNGAFLSVLEPLSGGVAEVNSQAMIQHSFSTASLFSRVGSSSSHKCCAATREWDSEYLDKTHLGFRKSNDCHQKKIMMFRKVNWINHTWAICWSYIWHHFWLRN